MHVKTLYRICIYNRLPADEPSGSKHVEDIKKLKKILEKVHVAGWYCLIILQYTVQKNVQKEI
jgi:hypothetical protein